jgi:hypothetical protein
MMMFAGDPATTVITFKEISAGSVIYISHINSLNVSNEMQLLGTFIIVTALHVSETSRQSGTYENFKCS